MLGQLRVHGHEERIGLVLASNGLGNVSQPIPNIGHLVHAEGQGRNAKGA